MERTLMVLAALIRGGPTGTVSLQEVAATTGLPAATAHRILTRCVAYGMATQLEDRRYTLGPGLLALGLSAAAEWGLRPIAQDALSSLAEAAREESYLTMRVGDHGVYVERARSPEPVRVAEALFHNVPLHCGASRKVLLAHLDDAALADYLSRPLERFTDATLTEPAAVRRELAGIRERGFAVSRGERLAGVIGIAAPVMGPRGSVIASVSVLGPAYSLHDDRIAALIPLVQRTASAISGSLRAALLGLHAPGDGELSKQGPSKRSAIIAENN